MCFCLPLPAPAVSIELLFRQVDHLQIFLGPRIWFLGWRHFNDHPRLRQTSPWPPKESRVDCSSAWSSKQVHVLYLLSIRSVWPVDRLCQSCLWRNPGSSPDSSTCLILNMDGFHNHESRLNIKGVSALPTWARPDRLVSRFLELELRFDVTRLGCLRRQTSGL